MLGAAVRPAETPVGAAMAAPSAAANVLATQPDELAIRYSLDRDPTKLLLRVAWMHGAISQDNIVDFLMADGARRPAAARTSDPARLIPRV